MWRRLEDGVSVPVSSGASAAAVDPTEAVVADEAAVATDFEAASTTVVN